MKQYRPDIDGLRAIAVLSVVIYHLNKTWMPGGYTGVDIFFVISGFLITRNIWGEMERGDFSFSRFYVRRIKRIAPAFLAMLAITVTAGALLLLPDALLELAKSTVWGLASMSNIYFWKYLDTDYFADSSDEVPLLHTWSLGVEEQFYFIWPVVLLILAHTVKRRTPTLTIAVLLGAASFVCAELTNVAAQKFSYYMLPARGGELMIGAILALLPAVAVPEGGRASRLKADAIAVLGYGLVIYSLYGLDDASKFPGLNALFPCLGAALLILAGERRSHLTGLLTLRPMVFIGLISYSLYLWHWPVLAFIRYFYGEIQGGWIAIAVVAMLLLAIASYRFVEVPARHWKARQWVQVVVLYVLPSLVLLAAGGYIWHKQGLKDAIESSDAYRSGLEKVDQYTAPAFKFPYNCQLSAFDAGILDNPRCVVPEGTGGESGVLLWGDSQAAHYLGVIGSVAERDGFRFRNATHSSCPPVFGGNYGVGVYKAGCDLFRPYIEASLRDGRFKTVVISGAWGTYDAIPGFRQDLERTVREINALGVKLVIVGQMPVFMAYNRECELRSIRIGGGSCRQRLAVPDIRDSDVNRYLAALAGRTGNGVEYLDVRGIVCRDGVCNPYLDDRPVYYDASHLSMDGSWLIGRKLVHSDLYGKWSAALALGKGQGANVPTPSPSRPSGAFSPRTSPPLLGGYVPRFPHHVRSQAGLSPGASSSGIVLEFWGIAPDAVIAQVEGDLSALGFRLASRGQSGDAVRLDFSRPNTRAISVNVGPLGNLVPQAPEASGIVYIRW